MAQKVAKLGIQRDNNYLYYIKGGDVWQVPRKRPGMKKQKSTKLAPGGVTMESGFIYFLDKAGDIARVKAAVGGQKRKKKTTRAPARAAAKKKVATKTTRRPAAKRTTTSRTKAKKR
ncbi:MAG TPA: hypothetical protein VK698_16855 [Kofleriaceae bacterium]|nr:hypothetical protein [Kofleriaceae bacterium]